MALSSFCHILAAMMKMKVADNGATQQGRHNQRTFVLPVHFIAILFDKVVPVIEARFSHDTLSDVTYIEDGENIQPPHDFQFPSESPNPPACEDLSHPAIPPLKIHSIRKRLGITKLTFQLIFSLEVNPYGLLGEGRFSCTAGLSDSLGIENRVVAEYSLRLQCT